MCHKIILWRHRLKVYSWMFPTNEIPSHFYGLFYGFQNIWLSYDALLSYLNSVQTFLCWNKITKPAIFLCVSSVLPNFGNAPPAPPPQRQSFNTHPSAHTHAHTHAQEFISWPRGSPFQVYVFIHRIWTRPSKALGASTPRDEARTCHRAQGKGRQARQMATGLPAK